MANSAMKLYSLNEMKDKYVGIKGTKERDKYEFELRKEILVRMKKAK